MNQEGGVACCAVCNEETQRRCGRCLHVYYCNTEHQRQDWRRHRNECVPKLVTDNSGERSTLGKEDTKKEKESSNEAMQKSSTQKCSHTHIKSKTKNVKRRDKGGSTDNVSKHSEVATKNFEESEEALVKTTAHSDNSVISSVVYTNRDLSNKSAITYEGSSEQEVLRESAQQLSTVDFATAGTSNVLRPVGKSDSSKMPVLPNYSAEQGSRVKEYPEASLKGSGAPFNHMPNSFFMDPSDPCYEICQRVIKDMTRFGVCVLNNFLGQERGQMVLQEVLDIYKSGIFSVSLFSLLVDNNIK